MKTPDKIKIVRFSDTKELSDYWVLENNTNNESIEYIRKDALLEDLEEMAANTGSDFQKAVIELVIHKIKSL